jgi:hypothetical protein
MNTIRSIFGALYDKILVAIGVLIVLLPISPLNIVQPARDSGVFLYVGWRMLQGEIHLCESAQSQAFTALRSPHSRHQQK